MAYEIHTLAERPELLGEVWTLNPTWPEFMYHGPVADAHYGQLVDTFHDYTLVATEEGRAVARGHTLPVALDLPGRRNLPPDGWDRMLIWAFDDHRRGRRTDTVSAVEVVIDPAHRGRGLSTLMLRAMADNARTKGSSRLIVPVRPTAKHERPETPLDAYVRDVAPDGLPRDPWLRTHVQLGGEIAGIAPASMTIPGSLEQWRTWTSLPFDKDGPVIVPGALAPIHCAASFGYAVYVEPNVWISHNLT
ncbi:hypothetical protein GCM10009801_18870 [Streptomyces albiaxialis]|uniref:N-acetyltransferase domain-containing protein n=1 Tax=Streptomyces albiaxialis TaxID=329523 RepID=A0ABN2VQJ7_9ACTN